MPGKTKLYEKENVVLWHKSYEVHLWILFA